MPFPSAYSGADLIRIRGGVESANGYVAVHSPSVIVQFNPSANNTANEAAAITYSTVLSGDGTDTLKGMTVIISPSSSWESDMRDKPDACLITYVRTIGSGASSGTLGIGKTAYQWTTSDYVTVIDDFRVFKREVRIVSTTIYHDWDRTYTTPLPRIYNLEADVVVISGSSTSYSPTPSAAAMKSGGSISSWSWSKIMSGTVTKNVSAVQNPSITLNLGWNWLHLTVTDNSSEENYLVMPVLVVNPDFSQSVILTGVVSLGVERSLADGCNASVSAITGVDSLTPGTNALVINQMDYVDGTSETSVACYGWLDEMSGNTQGDDNFGVVKTAQFSIAGIVQQMEKYQIVARYLQEKTSPAAWGELARVTPFDAVWYAISEFSTIFNVAAISVGNTYTNFRFSTLDIPQGDFHNLIDELLFRASGSIAAYTAHGAVYVDTSLLYDSSANRDAATVITTLASGDGTIVGIDTPNGLPVEQIELGCAVYQGTNNLPRVYRALAPSDFTSGALREQLDGVLLVAGSTDASAKTQAGELAANHWAASNASPELSFVVLAGYHEMTPIAHQWYKLNFSDFPTGHIFDTNTRLLLTSVSLSYDISGGSIATALQLRKETSSDKFAQFVEYIAIGTTTELEYIPPTLYPGVVGADDVYSDEPCWQDIDLQPEVAERLRNCQPGAEILFVPFHANTAVAMSNNTVALETYTIEIEGYTDENVGGTTTIDFDTTSPDSTGTTDAAKWTVSSPGTGGNPNGCFQIVLQATSTYFNEYGWIEINLGSTQTITGITYDYYVELTNTNTNGSQAYVIADTVQLLRDTNIPHTDGAWRATDVSTDWDGGDTLFPFDAQVVRLGFALSTGPQGIGDLIRVDNVVITISGGGQDDVIDAFYTLDVVTDTATQHATGDGLQLNGADITSIPTFSRNHAYRVEEAGTGSAFSFRFDDSVYSDNAEGWLKITVTGQGL